MARLPDNLSKKERRQLEREERERQRADVLRRQKIRRASFWFLIVAFIVGSIWGLIELSGRSAATQNASLSDAVLPTDHVEGNKDATTVLVEYSDFQCPACKYYYPLVKQLSSEIGDRIKIVYRHFPLRSVHQNAEEAAWAAEAAADQGKFWEMHNMLFENQDEWARIRDPRDTFFGYAVQLSLNREQFIKDFDSDVTHQRVEGQYQSGVQSGVKGTPTFFIDGKSFANPQNYAEFRDAITRAIE